ncbi:hypothetical protein CJF26_13830 [Photobacterium phosphoreum]|nr:hypothetical protein [Photobacterium phosphoreum]
MARKDFSNGQINLCFNLFKKYNMTRYGMKDVPMKGRFYPQDDIAKKINKINNNISNYLEITRVDYDKDKGEFDYILLLNELEECFGIDKYNIIDNGINNKVLASLFLSVKNDKLKNISEKIILKKDYLDVLLDLDAFYSIFISFSNSNDKHYSVFFRMIENYVRYINTDYINLDRFMIIDKFYDMIKIDDLNIYEAVNDNDLYELTQAYYFINKNSESRGEFNISSYQEFIGIQEVFTKFSNLFSSFDIKWNGISSGQYSMLTLFSRINSEFNSNNDVIIIIDEGEVNLHPEWQRTYISDLIDFIMSIKEEKQQVKLILTSHSPFVLSDLPMPSINIVGSDFEDGTSLFGANIYDIYNKGFMLEKTVGQFSYGKIEEIIKSIKNNGHNPETDKLISLIGDKFIKDILSNLDSD